MTYQDIGSYGFLTDYVHLTFLAGIIISYLYFRRKQISIGGSLAVGYLASALYMPQNVMMTVLVSLLGFVIIRFVVLKIFLPRPRQIFAIGLAVGVICGGIWLAVSSWLLDGVPDYGLALIGVIVPGMICNSLIKQGVVKTLVPLAWMVPVTGIVGLGLTVATSNMLPLSMSAQFTDPSIEPLPMLFLMSALSVLFAVLVQEGTVRNWKLRTGGYVTSGVIIAALTNWWYVAVLAVAMLGVYGIYMLYSRRVPLFGKDRFVVLCSLAFTLVTIIEMGVAAIWGVRFGGPQNVVFCVLPAIIANDLVQYGWRRTGAGVGISLAGVAAVGVPVMAWT
ncbi:MAG TPA: poly-gamma-glutamate biosynthesis protein PgsC/CapC [Candidatus Corynebacterium avicola]|uniref:Poly-gamma-glutamate biosynthesis protein PgsC/CapC n=1 Tax=Candidatus Corynebacterium avicola TaxID=2838527 RepID=A0A9D1RNZ2_9CORY|nr:poly-gamma-glutamate biosynthesis protein PgsC/CapC [Candidatus Corynebacterium avicola]